MKERPINLKAWEVRAIREGRKTQTRRIFKFRETNQPPACPDKFDPKAVTQPCPYGTDGDRLWVRETFFHEPEEYDYVSGRVRLKPVSLYRADGYGDWIGKWTPSIHMPRWASRIDLEVVSVRVERLNEITPSDCRAEGQPSANNDIGVRYGFGQQWEADNGPGSWDANPWVWVVEFRRV